MKLKDLMEKYGEYEVDSKCVVGECEIERIVIDLTKPKPKSVWDLEKGDKHFWIDGLGHIWINEYIDLGARDIGNLFLDREEAHKEVERRKVETLLLKYGGRRWLKKDGDNHYLWVTNTGYGLILGNTCDQIQGTIYFDSKVELTKAVEEIGADRIRDALYEVR